MLIRRATSILTTGFLTMLSILAAAQPSPSPTPQQLRADPVEGWLTNGGNSFNQRYSPLTQINRTTVAKLKAEWQVHMNGSGSGPNHSGQAQPLFQSGVLYVSTGENDVFAIDVETGKNLWVYQARLDPSRVQVCCGWVNRGVAMGEGQIYIGQLDAKLVALDQATGKINWQIQVEDPLQGFSLTAAPLYYDGMVIMGIAGGERATRGRIKAFDAKTGALKWTFYTIPGPGEFGHDTWPNNNAWEVGGAPIWHTPAVDPALGLLYFSTGNAGPDLNGSNRAGDNLFTASIIALDVKTGKYKWHYQQVHHDIWDYDAPNPVILFDAPVNGVARKGIAEVGKSGFLYILDRVTGQPLLPIPEVDVPQEPRNATAKTQPWPSGDPVVPNEITAAPAGYKLVNNGRTFTPFATEPVLYKPYSGVNWPPSAYDPQSHLMYICANDRIGAAQREAENSAPRHDSNWLGGTLTPPTAQAVHGLFVAMDLTTHKIAWSQQWDYLCSAGSLVTAGGLVIHGRNDGRVVALDKSNGKLLWEYQTDAGVNGSASTFMYKGTQYVAIISAGSAYATGPHGDSVWLFSLKGSKASPPVVSLLPNTAVPTTAAAVTAVAGYKADLASGRKIYTTLCVTCHGDNGEGGHQGGVPLQGKPLSVDQIMTMASNGRNQMPGFRAAYTREQLQDVATFVIDELLKKK